MRPRADWIRQTVTVHRSAVVLAHRRVLGRGSRVSRGCTPIRIFGCSSASALQGILTHPRRRGRTWNRYVRWPQETRRYKPSMVSRRASVIAEFYRTCVIDGVLQPSSADYFRRPTVPPESPTRDSPTCSAKRCSPPAANPPTTTTSPSSRCSVCWGCGSLSDRHRCRRPRRRTRPPGCAGCRQGHPDRSGPAAVGGRSRDRPVRRRTRHRTDPAQHPRWADGPARRHAPRRDLASQAGVRHRFVATMLDAGVDLRDVQMAARPARRPPDDDAL